MHFEFKNILKNAIKCPEFVEFLRERYAVTDESLAAIDVEVSDCPKGIEAELMSGVTYALVKQLERVVGGEINPCPVAEKIIEIAERLAITKSGKLFNFCIGGSGFINASSTKELFPQMIKSFLKDGWGVFFSPSTMIFEDQLVCDKDLREMQRQFCEISYRPEQLISSSNEDVRLLMKARPGQEFNRETALMATALLSDDELDVNAYLNGVNGKQNVPWFIRRFVADAKSFENEILSRFSIRDLILDEESFPREIRGAKILIQKFRQVLFGALHGKRPEVLLRHLFEMMRAFYVYYNHPTWRGFRGEVGSYQVIYYVTQVLNKLVHSGLYVLDFSCDNERFVLERAC